jgi:hypothetical protein
MRDYDDNYPAPATDRRETRSKAADYPELEPALRLATCAEQPRPLAQLSRYARQIEAAVLRQFGG